MGEPITVAQAIGRLAFPDNRTRWADGYAAALREFQRGEIVPDEPHPHTVALADIGIVESPPFSYCQGCPADEIWRRPWFASEGEIAALIEHEEDCPVADARSVMEAHNGN